MRNWGLTHWALVLGASAAPKGVVCLLSALQFHIVGTQLPRQLWMALPPKTRSASIDYPPIRFIRMSGDAYVAGIEEHTLEGQTVRIYDVAKTVVDCFKFRNKIGMDVALEALNESWRERRLDLNLVAQYARICRVWNVMRPYLDEIIANGSSRTGAHSGIEGMADIAQKGRHRYSFYTWLVRNSWWAESLPASCMIL